MKKLLVLSISIFFVLKSYAQVESPPTLALGVSGIVGEKGSIDVDVLAQLISAKQTELKKEFIKTSIYNSLANENYVVWDYSYKTLNVLLESESKEAIKKNLLSNSANLALVLGFAEFYLQISGKLGNDPLNDLLKKFNKSHTSIASNDEIKLLLSEYKTGYDLEKGSKNISFSSFFIDLVYEVLKQNKTLTSDLGFLADSYPLGKEFYEQKSNYFLLKDVSDVSSEITALKERMDNEVRVLFDYYMVLNKIKDRDKKIETIISDLNNELTSSTFLDGVKLGPGNAFVEKLYDELVSKTDSILIDLRNVTGLNYTENFKNAQNIAISQSQTTSPTDLNKKLTENILAFNKFLDQNKKFKQQDLYYIEKSITPLLIELITNRGFDPKYLKVTQEFDKLITFQLLNELKDSLKLQSSLKPLLKQEISDYAEILDYFSRFDELDKVETYLFVLNTAEMAGEIFADRKVGAILNMLTSTINDYTIINKEDNQIELAVEDIITLMYEKYANRQGRNVSLYFSIGANQAFGDYRFRTQTLLPDSSGFDVDTTNLNSLAYVSEKIGIKVKLFDYKKRNSYDIGEEPEWWGVLGGHGKKKIKDFKPKEPIVSDVYALTYVSGFLYKIANLTTEEEFNDPIWGVGIGIAFFNSLDLNVTYSKPFRTGNDFFENAKDDHLFSVGFDVKITEYLEALGKKRKQKNK